MAGRGSSDGSKTSEGLRNIVLVGAGLQVRVWQANLGSNSTDPTSVGIDDTSADSDTSRKTEVGSSLFAKSTNLVTSSVVLSAHPVYTTQALEIVFAKTLKTDLL